MSYRPRRPYEPGGPLIVATPPPRPLRDLTPSVRRLRRVRFEDPRDEDWTTLETYLPIIRPDRRVRWTALIDDGDTLIKTIGPLPRGTSIRAVQTFTDTTPFVGDDFKWRLYQSRTAPANFAALSPVDITWPWELDENGLPAWDFTFGFGGFVTIFPRDRRRPFDAYHTLALSNNLGLAVAFEIRFEPTLPTLSPRE